MPPVKFNPIMVEIIDVPKGEDYPEEVRKAWLGLSLPMVAKMPDHLHRIRLLLKDEEAALVRRGSYLIPISWALDELRKAGRISAYNFFAGHFSGGQRSESKYHFALFEFNRECCNEIQQ